MKSKRIRSAFFMCIALFLLLLLVSCGSKGGKNEGGDENGSKPVKSIKLTTDKYTLTANGKSKAVITATVADDDGELVDGKELINFTMISGTGRFTSPYQDEVTEYDYTSNGLAMVTFIASEESGTVTIEAKSENGVSDTIDIMVENGGIILSAVTKELLADGKSESIITATVRDPAGNVVTEEERIEFAITSGAGTLSSEEFVSVNETSGQILSTLGTANVKYTASETPGNVIITASANGYTTGSIDMMLLDIGVISLTAEKSSILADGQSTTLIDAVIRDNLGNPVPSGTSVIFPQQPADLLIMNE